MKNVLISVLLVALLATSWLVFFAGIAKDEREYNECLKNAEASMKEELYEQAIEYYKASMEYKVEEQTYLWIKEAYDLFYAEEPTSYVRECYIADMAEAAKEYPKNEIFWLQQIKLHLDTGDHSDAYKVAKSALNKKVKSDELDRIYNELLYMVKVSYKRYDEVHSALNGYVAAFDGTSWVGLDEYGEVITSRYDYIGLLNDDGKGMFTNAVGCRILDKKQVARAKLRKNFTAAGLYNESVNLMPVEYEGKWRYTNSKGELLPGSYDICGGFVNKRAVACRDGVWMLVDASGDEKVLSGIEDVKLGVNGCHLQSDVVIAKQGGKYHLYDEDFKQIGSFAADDMDIHVSKQGIAFKNGDKWGFVDTKGKVLIQPKYAGAKSFSHDYAAVCDENGLWGFITEDEILVIKHTYLDAMYFTEAETCWVSVNEGSWQLLKFMFE